MKQHLPIELHRQIISRLPRNALYKCFYVCKAWQAIAAQIYYKEIYVSSRNIVKLKELLQSKDFIFHYGLYARSLYIDSHFVSPESSEEEETPESNCFTPKELEILLSFTPNLKQVDFSHSPYRSDYISMFHQLAINIPIEEFSCSAGCNDEYEASYFALCHSYRDSLKHMYVFYNFYNEEFDEKPPHCVLSEFTQLTHLTFFNDYDPELVLFDILEICPNLMYFKFTSYIPVSESTSESLATLLLRYNITRGKVASSLPHNQFLEHLEIDVPVLTMPLIEYITWYTPLHLKTLRIKMDDYLYDWIRDAGIQNVLQLAKRMSLADSVRIYSCPSEPLSWRPSNGPCRITQFFQMANALKGDREMYCSFSCSDNRTDATDEYAIAVYDKRHLSLNYALSSEDWEDPVQSALKIPDRSLSHIGFESVNSFKLRMSHCVQSSMLSLMTSTFNNCPRMDFYDAFYWKSDIVIRCGKPSFSVYSNRTSKRLSDVKIRCDPSLREWFSKGIKQHFPHSTSIQFFDNNPKPDN
ncbi:hypothetical protein BD560DRAFT_398110 [Blakeslea trispora]|nr:hypothetical protein BD560DRAFT_398110 [Blakeslea trispora]